MPTKKQANWSESLSPLLGYQTWLSESENQPLQNWGKYAYPSQILNKAIRRLKDIIPTLEEYLHKLHDMKNMTIIDMKEAFQNIPNTLATTALCLACYNLNFPVVFQVDDASDYGLGAALLQPTKLLYDKTFNEASLQPVAYSSKRPTPTEQRYAQIEKECLAIVEAFNKFDQWLLGKPDVTVHTDHQPLQSIFQKDLAAAPKRLQKMKVFLQRFNFKVVYKQGSPLHLADTLTRGPSQGHDKQTHEIDTF